MDIISKRTRRAFAEYLSGFSVIRTIEAYFDDGDVKHIELGKHEQMSGARRSLVYSYYKTINWQDWSDVSKIVSVFEVILNEIDEGNEYAKHQKDRLLIFLNSDGFHFEASKLVYKSNFPIANKSVLQTTKIVNINQLKLHIQRIENSINSDPDLAIGNAKELIETVCKNLLDAMNVQYSNANDLPQLMKLVAKQLNLTPENINDGAKGVETIRRVLSNLSTVVNGISELRNLYGSGHGKSKAYTGLQPRHARLVVGASTVLASFVIETYEAQNLEK